MAPSNDRFLSDAYEAVLLRRPCFGALKPGR